MLSQPRKVVSLYYSYITHVDNHHICIAMCFLLIWFWYIVASLQVCYITLCDYFWGWGI